MSSKLNKKIFLYVSVLPNDDNNFNLWKSFSLKLSEKSQVVFISSFDYLYPYSTKAFYLNFGIFNFIKQYIDILLGKPFVHFKFYSLFPYKILGNRIGLKCFELINTLCLKFLSLLIKVKNKRKVFLSNQYSSEIQRIFHAFKPDFSIADCGDIWTKEVMTLTGRDFSRILCTTPAILELNHSLGNSAFLASSGYFLSEHIRKIHKKVIFDKDKMTVLCISTITWRFDFDLLSEIILKLPDYKFLFLATELFDFFNEMMTAKQQKIAKVALKKWQTIKRLKNVQIIHITNQEEINQVAFQASIGIAPYRMDDPFNIYCHPIKMYYYFSLGIPTVISPILIAKKYESSFVSTAYRPEDWVKKIKLMSKKKFTQKTKAMYFNLAIQQSFEKKIDDIERVL